MTKKCFHGDEEVTRLQRLWAKKVEDIHNQYAYTDCIDSHGKENTMNDQPQRILAAADSAHQGIELARSLLQESLGNMGEILTQGCMALGPASLGSAMRLGQSIKEVRFILDDLLKGAHGLCVLLGNDLGVCEDKGSEVKIIQSPPLSTEEDYEHLLGVDPEPGHRRPVTAPDYHRDMAEAQLRALDDLENADEDWLFGHCAPDIPEPIPGEDEFDDATQPF